MLLLGAPLSHAQGLAPYPAKTVRIVIPFGGGGTNLIARWLAPKFSEAFGVTFVVDPRVGAGGNIGNELVAKSVPDGYTLLIAPPGLVFSPFAMENWYGFYGPAALPRDIVERLNAEAVKAMKMPDTRERLGSQGFDLFPSTPQALAALVKSEYARFGNIVRHAGIQPE